MRQPNQTVTQPLTGFAYYAALAQDVHEVADRIAALADLAPDGQLPPRLSSVGFYATVSSNEHQAAETMPVVDLLAEVFGGRAEAEHRQYMSEYKAHSSVGAVRVLVATHIPQPDTSGLREENERLRAELEELRGHRPRGTENGDPTAPIVDHAGHQVTGRAGGAR